MRLILTYFTCFHIHTWLACLYTSELGFGILLCVGVGVVGGGTQTYTFHMILYSHVACLLVHIGVRVWNFVVCWGGCGRRWDSDLHISHDFIFTRGLLVCRYRS